MIYTLQILRGFAALLVVLDHISIPITFFNETQGGPFGHGAFGVEIFFIISGFIMVATTTEGKVSANPVAFMRNRIVRIVPLYWSITLFVFALGMLSPRSFPNSDLSLNGLLASLFFIPRGVSPLVFVGWTLNFEMFFYLIFAAGLAIAPKFRVAFVTFTILALIAVGAAISFNNPVYAFVTNPIMFEFLVGVGMGAAYMKHRLWFTAHYSKFALISAAAVAFFTQFFFSIEVNSWWRVIQFTPCAAVIVFCALALEDKVDVSAWKSVILIGNASYSIYLTHFFVARVYDKLPGFEFAARSMVAGLACSLGILVAAAVVGIAIHILVEKRFERFFRDLRRPAVIAA